MTWTSPTTINVTKGLPEITSYTNTVTNSWLSNLLLIGLWLLVVIGAYKSREDLSGALAVGGWVVFTAGLLMWLGGWITGITLGVVIGIAIITSLPIFFDKS